MLELGTGAGAGAGAGAVGLLQVAHVCRRQGLMPQGQVAQGCRLQGQMQGRVVSFRVRGHRLRGAALAVAVTVTVTGTGQAWVGDPSGAVRLLSHYVVLWSVG